MEVKKFQALTPDELVANLELIILGGGTIVTVTELASARTHFVVTYTI